MQEEFSFLRPGGVKDEVAAMRTYIESYAFEVGESTAEVSVQHFYRGEMCVVLARCGSDAGRL
jgi:hypothetical protein